ncbi:MAG: hypothetical protein EON59_01355 [Alphaproteobacteria bacterium]|nr:MAG: hypothetical protein EON59_01355 [Alphaproteobacteria bacterium]
MSPLNAIDLRSKAAELVREHAARLGMDCMAADYLVRAIRALPAEGEIDPVELIALKGRDRQKLSGLGVTFSLSDARKAIGSTGSDYGLQRWLRHLGFEPAREPGNWKLSASAGAAQ